MPNSIAVWTFSQGKYNLKSHQTYSTISLVDQTLPWKTLYLKKTNKNNKSLPWSFSSSSSDSSSMTSSLTSFSYSSLADFGFLEGVTSSGFSVSGFFSTLSSCWSSSRSEEDLVLTIWLLFPLPFPLPLPTNKKAH